MYDYFSQEPRYRFNRQVGIPLETRPHQNTYFKNRIGKPVQFTKHAHERAAGYGVDLNKIPNWDGNFPQGAHGWRTEEIEHNGKAVRKMTLRGPYSDTHDMILPIDDQGRISTVMVNPKNDHKKENATFNGHTVHFPEEFLNGSPPSRIWDPKGPKPGFIPHTDPNFKATVLKEHGADARKEKMGFTVPKPIDVAAMNSCINFEKLASKMCDLTDLYWG